MEFQEENFAVYQLLVKLDMAGVENMKADFAAAKTGTDDDKYKFALGIYGLVTTPGIEAALPGLTKTIVDNTLEQALAVFEDTAGRGHPHAALMAAWCRASGIGCIEDKTIAKQWLDQSDDAVGPSDFSRELRSRISTVMVVFPPQKPKAP
ncbi:MAG: hypothetical protein PW788_13475 [Micavibrio sp.]|nr:hypothetical protein [Micavibrio sp.]